MNPHSRDLAIRVTVSFVGERAVPWSVVVPPNGGRWEMNLADVAPMPLVGIHNATVRIDCDAAWCPTWAAVYADALRRGTVASTPEIKWGCPQ